MTDRQQTSEKIKEGVTITVLVVAIVLFAFGFVILMQHGGKVSLCRQYSETMDAYEECMK